MLRFSLIKPSAVTIFFSTVGSFFRPYAVFLISIDQTRFFFTYQTRVQFIVCIKIFHIFFIFTARGKWVSVVIPFLLLITRPFIQGFRQGRQHVLTFCMSQQIPRIRKRRRRRRQAPSTFGMKRCIIIPKCLKQIVTRPTKDVLFFWIVLCAPRRPRVHLFPALSAQEGRALFLRH